MKHHHTLSVREKLLNGSAWTFAGKVITSLSGLACSALIARLLSPAEMGTYFLILSFITANVLLVQLGLPQTAIKIISESLSRNQKARVRLTIRFIIIITGIGASITAIGILLSRKIWVGFLLPDSILAIQIFSLIMLWMIILVFQNLFAEIFRGFHDIRLATIFGGLTTGVISAVLFFIVWNFYGHANLKSIIQIILFSCIISVSFSSYFIFKKIISLPLPSGNEIEALFLLKRSLPLWITNITLFVLIQSTLWIISFFHSQSEVALYGAAAWTIALITVPLQIINAVLPPIIAELNAKAELVKMEKTLRNIASLIGLPSLCVLFILAISGNSVLSIFLGDYYKDANLILVILSIGQLVNVWAGSCGQVLMFTGFQSVMMKITIFCGSCTILIAVTLVPPYGGIGGAIAASTGMVLQNLLMLIYTKKKVGIWTHMSLKKISFGTTHD